MPERAVRHLLQIVLVLFCAVGCAKTIPPPELATTLREHPEFILSALEGHETELLDLLQRGMTQRDQRAQLERKQRELDHPYKPYIDSSRPIRGPVEASITIVEYSDFQCPYCRQVVDTVSSLLKRYPDDVRLVYKHLPLSNHPLATPAAHFFEAIALQNPQEAWKFHDEVFRRQHELTEAVLQEIVVSLHVDPAMVANDLTHPQVLSHVKQDEAEAVTMGFDGTPAFLVNGVSIRGAMPAQEFVDLIELLLQKTSPAKQLSSPAMEVP